jgi:hypothetical protein
MFKKINRSYITMSANYRLIFTLLLVLSIGDLCFPNTSKAIPQNRDTSLNITNILTGKLMDTVQKERSKKRSYPDSTHSPSLAFKRSLIIPGWGQIYNRRWWKVPIVYAGLGLLSSAVVFNQRYYKQYLRILFLVRRSERPNADDSQEIKTLYANISKESPTAIENAVNGYQRNMQLSILGIAGAWTIQAIDAYIDAKFIHSYTMDRDLSFRIKPSILLLPSAGGLTKAAIPMLTIVIASRSK